MQADISGDVAENCAAASVRRAGRLTKRETVNQQAYELALQGRFMARRAGHQNQKKAIEYYQQAIAIDPNYASPMWACQTIIGVSSSTVFWIRMRLAEGRSGSAEGTRAR